MELVRITKEFKFEMAHAFFGYDGKHCKYTWTFIQIVDHFRGRGRHEKGFVKDGMVLDFGNLKK